MRSVLSLWNVLLDVCENSKDTTQKNQWNTAENVIAPMNQPYLVGYLVFGINPNTETHFSDTQMKQYNIIESFTYLFKITFLS